MDYFYDEQLRRYLMQFIRIFGNFNVKTGINGDGEAALLRVPVRYADMSRQVAHIINNNSENVMKSAPFMTCHISNLAVDRSRTGPSHYIDKKQINERAFNEETQSYSSEVGNRYSTERAYPVPYTLTLQLDMWTTNTDQKMQLLEQIMMVFNPSLNVQSSSNLLDWTRLSVVELTDITWSSRSVPQGTDSAIDIASMTFKADIWISPPAKVLEQKIIHKIITNINEFGTIDENCFDASDLFSGTPLSRQIITPKMESVTLNNGIVTLSSGDVWTEYLNTLGVFTNGYTQLRFKAIDADVEVDSFDIVGTIATTAEPTELAFTLDIDTLPANDFTVDAIVNPQYSSVSLLPAPAINTRYIITDNITPNSFWGSLEASENDIVTWNGSEWVVDFDASANNINIYAKHLFTGDQLRWYNGEWISNYFGTYAPGYWNIAF